MNIVLDLSREFNALAQQAEQALLETSPVQILNVGKDARESDYALLSKVLNVTGGNVYAIWGKRKPTDNWFPLYIGQRKQKDLKTRLTQHLFKVHPKTESKLKRVEEYVKSGGQIGVTVILIIPDELRTSVEQRLIKNNINKQPGWLLWNTHS